MSIDATRHRGRTVFLSAIAVAVVAAAGVFAVGLGPTGDADADDGDADDARPGSAASTAAVTRRDLAEQASLTGSLGYGEAEALNLTANGTITALPEPGTVVDRGDVLLEVDGKPVPLLVGDRPLWRRLDSSATDGEDVRQVEQNLLAMGFATEETLTVDDDWTAATTWAVKKWQSSYDLDQTGVVEPAEVVMWPTAVRVADHPVAVGAPASGQVLSVTTAERLVTIDLDAAKQSMLSEGQAVSVDLPDGTRVDGTIRAIGAVATSDSNSDPLNPSTPKIEVTVALGDGAEVGAWDEAPVTVLVTTSAATDVLAVPVEALLALAEGGYAVEVPTPTGTDLVAVTTGAFADGWVEVEGEIAEGDEVVVPS